MELAERHGLETHSTAMKETLDDAERRTRSAIEEMDDGEREATDVLEAADGDLELKLKATVDGDELTLDFTGSADQYDGNLNCPLAVTTSACYFAVRVLTDPDVPPCAGAYRPVTVIAPEGSLLSLGATASTRSGRPWPRRSTTPSAERGPASRSSTTESAARATCSRRVTTTSSCGSRRP